METFEQAVEADKAAKESSSAATDTSSISTATPPEPTQDGEAGETKPEPTGKVVKLPESLKPKQPTGRFQQRISDLVQSRKQAEEENRRLREQLAQFTDARNSTPRPGAQPMAKPAAADPNAPLNPEDFDTYADYVQALVDRTVEQREAAKQSRQNQKAYEDYKQEKQTEFETHAAQLAEQYGEGFWDAITDPQLLVSEPMVDAIMELGEMGPYTMLWLAANKQEAAKMHRMNPRQATIAIGRLAAKLTQELEADGGAPEPGQGPPPQASQPAAAMRPRPTPVPTPRGGSPANSLDTLPSDKDDVHTWLQKETNRIRRMNPNARFYGAQ